MHRLKVPSYGTTLSSETAILPVLDPKPHIRPYILRIGTFNPESRHCSSCNEVPLVLYRGTQIQLNH